jgi:mRNA interferase MazF
MARTNSSPFRVPSPHAAKKGLIVLDQIRTVDSIRLVKRVGAINARTQSTVLVTLQELFAE